MTNSVLEVVSKIGYEETIRGASLQLEFTLIDTVGTVNIYNLPDLFLQCGACVSQGKEC